MPKGHLYDEARPTASAPSSACPCKKHGCQRQFYYGTFSTRHATHTAGAPPVQVDVPQPTPVPVVGYGRGGGSLSRGVGVRH
jgi:hypothetical protein